MRALTKTEIARRQLGTALALYLKEKDPVSVHCLTCGGCEIAEQLALQQNMKTMRQFTLMANSKLDDRTYSRVKNQYWNAFKHARDLRGNDRDDSELLQEFTIKENEIRLFVGWSDFGFATACLPIEAQVYCTWFLALDGTKFSDDSLYFLAELDTIFPHLRDLSPERQRRRLRHTIDKYRHDKNFMNDSATDRSPLILP